MKQRSGFLMTLALIMLLCSSAYATEFEGRGSAVTTTISTNYSDSTTYTFTDIWVTNIAGVEVDCQVTAYDHAGDDLTSHLTILTGSSSGNSLVTIASGTGFFTLPAGETRLVRVRMMDTTRYIVGHAVIEWTSETAYVRKALVASVESFMHRSYGNTKSVAPVNGGQPF